MKLNVLIKVPEDLSITDPTWQASNAGAAWELSQVMATYTQGIAPGTTVSSPYKVIHCVLNVDTMADPLTYLNSLITIYGLDWTIIGLQSFGYEVAAVWDTTDPENPVLVEPAHPTVYKNVDTATLFPYLASRWNYDQDGNPTTEQTKELNWTHQFRGMAPWE